jgi:hypothetical protein
MRRALGPKPVVVVDVSADLVTGRLVRAWLVDCLFRTRRAHRATSFAWRHAMTSLLGASIACPPTVGAARPP